MNWKNVNEFFFFGINENSMNVSDAIYSPTCPRFSIAATWHFSTIFDISTQMFRSSTDYFRDFRYFDLFRSSRGFKNLFKAIFSHFLASAGR